MTRPLNNYQKLVGVSHEYLADLDPNKPIIAILNTDPIGAPGQHWIALATKGNKMYYYDSLGDKPLPFIAKYWPGQIVYYDSQQQPDASNKCGFYALKFVENAARLLAPLAADGLRNGFRNAKDFDFYDFGLDYLKPTQKNERDVLT